MAVPLTCASSPRVREALESLGRTEDLSFSPDGRRLAIAGFTRNRILVLDVDLPASAGRRDVQLTGSAELSSTALRRPHGVDFLDPDTLVVSNRAGDVTLFAVPASGQCVSADPIATWPAGVTSQLRAPGSVRVTRRDDEVCEILVCNNASHTVTRHVVRAGAAGQAPVTEILLRRHLDVPDGISQTLDRRWIAVSNHTTHHVLIFENADALDPEAPPTGILRGVRYPHGLSFSPDGRLLFVADAATPFIHIFERTGDGWAGVRSPGGSARVLEQAIYERGRHRPEEGGPKGLAIDPQNRLLATTCEHQPLVFFDVSALTAEARQAAGSSCQRSQEFSHELWLLDRERTMAASVSRARRLVRYLRNHRPWRLTAPLQRIDGALRRRR